MTYDVIVVGAGLVGAGAALHLAKLGYSVALVDAKSPLHVDSKADLRVLALSLKTMDWLASIGVLSRLDPERICRYQGMYVDDEQGASHFTLLASMIDRTQLGVMVDHNHLLATLQQALADKVDCFYEERLEALRKRDQGYDLKTNKRDIQAKIVLAADGAHSWIKAHLGISQHEHDFKQRAIVAYIQAEQPHDRIAWQRFLSTGSLALLPCSEPNRLSMVWTLPQDRANTVEESSEQAFNAALQAHMGDRLGALTLASERASFALKNRHVHAYGKEGVYLLGDAAHTVHPLAGLGANLGFSDVQALVSILKNTDKKHWADPRVLARYQRERMHANALISQLMICLNQGMTKQGVISTLRGYGLRLFDRMTPVKALSILFAEHL